MIEYIPALIALFSFFGKNKKYMILINLIIAIFLGTLFFFKGAYSGTITLFFVVIIGSYCFITNKKINKNIAVLTIFFISLILFGVNYYFNNTVTLLNFVPLIAFSLSRFAELSCDEFWYRVNSIIALSIYSIYAYIYQSYPIILTECILIFFNFYYLLKNNFILNFKYKY